MKICVTCVYCDPVQGDQGVCRYNPPRCALTPGAQPNTMQIVPLWPPVRMSTERCHFHEEQLVKPVPAGAIMQMGPRRQ